MTMATLMFITAYVSMFFVLNFNILVFAENINSGSNVGWELAFQKIKKLQKIVRAQDERISMLEKRP